MAQTQILAPQTAAQAAQLQISTQSGSVAVSADKLAGAETCPLYMMAGNTWIPVTDLDGKAQALTATVPAIVLAGGPVYGVTKSATAAACGIYVDHLARVY